MNGPWESQTNISRWATLFLSNYFTTCKKNLAFPFRNFKLSVRKIFFDTSNNLFPGMVPSWQNKCATFFRCSIHFEFQRLSFNSGINILSSSRSSLFFAQKTSGKKDDKVCQNVVAQEETEPDDVKGFRSCQSLKTKVSLASSVSFKFKYMS